MLERDFQDAVAQLARLHGFKVSHFRAAHTAAGWRTPVGYDGKGFPDLVMVNPRRRLILFVELKSERGGLTLEQQGWRDTLTQAAAHTTDVRYHCWKPSDADDIARTLTNGKVTKWRL